jgi:hypothetical protein
MDANEALIAFLTRALRHRRRERYIGFVSSPKARHKILEDFYHKFQDALNPANIVSELPPAAWQASAYCFAASGEFGTEAPSLQSAYDSHRDAFLLITRDARYGVHREEESTPTGEWLISLSHSGAA